MHYLQKVTIFFFAKSWRNINKRIKKVIKYKNEYLIMYCSYLGRMIWSNSFHDHTCIAHIFIHLTPLTLFGPHQNNLDKSSDARSITPNLTIYWWIKLRAVNTLYSLWVLSLLQAKVFVLFLIIFHGINSNLLCYHFYINLFTFFFHHGQAHKKLRQELCFFFFFWVILDLLLTY